VCILADGWGEKEAVLSGMISRKLTCMTVNICLFFCLFQRKISAHDRAKEQFESGEWATGQKWADDKPRENLDADSISIMNIGACGAFVHGLEDEFLGQWLYSTKSLEGAGVERSCSNF
jgi:hypothetical protein